MRTVQLDHFPPRIRGENLKKMKPPPTSSYNPYINWMNPNNTWVFSLQRTGRFSPRNGWWNGGGKTWQVLNPQLVVATRNARHLVCSFAHHSSTNQLIVVQLFVVGDQRILQVGASSQDEKKCETKSPQSGEEVEANNRFKRFLSLIENQRGLLVMASQKKWPYSGEPLSSLSSRCFALLRWFLQDGAPLTTFFVDLSLVITHLQPWLNRVC